MNESTRVSATDLSWCLVVPAKPLRQAKSRLGAYPDDRRAELALAFACDTVEAATRATRVARIIVVSTDPALTRAVAALGTSVVDDEPAGGLNTALAHGAVIARRRHPELGIATLSADLPALRPADLDEALHSAARHDRAFVADTPRVGTTLLAVRPGQPLEPSFGGASRAAHLASGAYEIAGPTLASLRRDVDTPADLAEALRLGVGSRTRAVVATLPEPA